MANDNMASTALFIEVINYLKKSIIAASIHIDLYFYLKLLDR